MANLNKYKACIRIPIVFGYSELNKKPKSDNQKKLFTKLKKACIDCYTGKISIDQFFKDTIVFSQNEYAYATMNKIFGEINIDPVLSQIVTTDTSTSNERNQSSVFKLFIKEHLMKYNIVSFMESSIEFWEMVDDKPLHSTIFITTYYEEVLKILEALKKANYGTVTNSLKYLKEVLGIISKINEDQYSIRSIYKISQNLSLFTEEMSKFFDKDFSYFEEMTETLEEKGMKIDFHSLNYINNASAKKEDSKNE